MFRPRLLLGAVIGGALVYFLDPRSGQERRERVRRWWEQNEFGARVNEAGEQVSARVSEFQSKVRDATG